MKKFKQFITEEDGELNITQLEVDEYYELLTFEDVGYNMKQIPGLSLSFKKDNKPVVLKVIGEMNSYLEYAEGIPVKFISHNLHEMFYVGFHKEKDFESIADDNFENEIIDDIDILLRDKRIYIIYDQSTLKFRKLDKYDPIVMQDLF